LFIAAIYGLTGAVMNSSVLDILKTNAAWQEMWTLNFFWIWFCLGAPFGLGLGITTGIALIWFSRNSMIGSECAS
jgi:DMSO reductase anchor subunit